MPPNACDCREVNMQYTTDGLKRTAPVTVLCPGFSRKRSMRLEYGAPEETRIRNLEEQIAEARRKGTPVDSLIEERRRTYESWLERLNRELDKAIAERDRESIKRQRERAIRDYKWPDS